MAVNLVVSLIDATFSSVQFKLSFLRERLLCENDTKIACNISSGRYGVRFNRM